MRRALQSIMLVLALTVASSSVLAQGASASDWPKRPIKVIIPFPPGGAPDALMRIIAQFVQADLGQPLVIENRPGAGTTIGAQHVASAQPDGYTLLLALDSTMNLAPQTIKDVRYDPLKDFAPITLLARNTGLLVTSGEGPASKTYRELLARGKAEPNKLTYGSPTVQGRLIMAFMAKKKGAHFVMVPFKGPPEVDQALLTKSIDFGSTAYATSRDLIASGKFIPLAKYTTNPIPLYPDLPSLADEIPELGDLTNWLGLFAPAGTPPEIIDRLNRVINTLYADKDVQERLEKAGMFAYAGSAVELGGLVKSDIERWKRIIAEVGYVAGE